MILILKSPIDALNYFLGNIEFWTKHKGKSILQRLFIFLSASDYPKYNAIKEVSRGLFWSKEQKSEVEPTGEASPSYCGFFQYCFPLMRYSFDRGSYHGSQQPDCPGNEGFPSIFSSFWAPQLEK